MLRRLVALSILTAVAIPAQQAFEETVVRMRDGVKLKTRVWKPPAEGRYPVVLERQYRAGNERNTAAFVDGGYIYVGQQTRGEGGADGSRFFSDAEDGFVTLSWIAAQPWCDGNIAMYGRSYGGATQWLTAPLRHPNLKAIIPQHMNHDFWDCVAGCRTELLELIERLRIRRKRRSISPVSCSVQRAAYGTSKPRRTMHDARLAQREPDIGSNAHDQ